MKQDPILQNNWTPTIIATIEVIHDAQEDFLQNHNHSPLLTTIKFVILRQRTFSFCQSHLSTLRQPPITLMGDFNKNPQEMCKLAGNLNLQLAKAKMTALSHIKATVLVNSYTLNVTAS